MELDDLEIGSDEVDLSGTAQDLMQDLIYMVIRQILRDGDRPKGWLNMSGEEADGPTVKEDRRRLALRELKS